MSISTRATTPTRPSTGCWPIRSPAPWPSRSPWQPNGPNTVIRQGATNNFTIPINITDSRFGTLSNFTVTLNVTHPTLANLSAVLIPPAGSVLSPITLFNTGSITGANLGTTAGGPVGTVFSDAATRSITATNASAPYVTGQFRPVGFGGLNINSGATAGQINGNWTLVLRDTTTPATTPPVQVLTNVTLTFTSGLAAGTESTIATTTVRSAGDNIGGSVSAGVSPVGIGPGLMIASDNTLGAFNQHQGRIYATYVNRDNTTAPANPADNTDIFLAYSDNGGRSWTSGIVSTRTIAQTDGYSEAFDGSNGLLGSGLAVSGRPQFLPSVAVDQSTGTLVMSWYDARNDASRVRVATYLTYSVDGGSNFSPQTYANISQTATDAITGKTVNLGPIPDNGRSNNDTTLGFGAHQGLAVSNGHVYPVWASNLNGGVAANAGHLLGTYLARVLIPAGPRIIDSTMGPVGNPGDS